MDLKLRNLQNQWRINLEVHKEEWKDQLLGISLRDKKRSWIRENTRVKDILVAIKEQKGRWAGHVARRKDNRWSK